MKKLTAIFLIFALLLTGCAGEPAPVKTENISADIPAREICLAEKPDCAEGVTEFSLNLFREGHREGENTLLSPLSVLAVLGMTANGAAGETLTQFADTFGLTQEDLNTWLCSRSDDGSLRMANSLWLRDDGKLQVEQSFLETNADYYQADIFKAPFTDETLSEINGWVSQKTENRIPQILDSIPEEAMLYLVNALTFDAKWEEPYKPFQVIEGTFLTEAGEEQDATYMSCTLSDYLETEQATGFLKYYENRDYAFAALIPTEGTSISELLDSLNGSQLHELLQNPREAVVKSSLPKFETGYSAELSDALKTLGITDAFDPEKADFSRLGSSDEGNLYISQVRHKTAITVAEEGTKAAAATIVEMMAGAAFRPDLKFVILDRPFVYMVVDCREQVPVFIGTVMDMSAAAPQEAP